MNLLAYKRFTWSGIILNRISHFLIYFFGALALAGTLGCNNGDSEDSVRPVILISLDTLRQDRLGCYGYGRNTSPELDRFAKEEAVLFESAYVQAPFTLPSHMSMLTGFYPETHGVLLPVLPDGKGTLGCLSDNFTTLAEALKADGYRTTAFTDGGLISKIYGFAQGFDEYRDFRRPNAEENGFRKHNKELYSWIKENKQQDFFLFIHTYDTHAPFVPPEPFKSQHCNTPPGGDVPKESLNLCSMLSYHEPFKLHNYSRLQDILNVYDGCVSFVDQEVGRLFKFLKEEGLFNNSLIIVTSDHGELFLENGLMIGHGVLASNEEMLVPLLIKFPDSLHKGRREKHIVESVDIMPTILSALDIPLPEDIQGQNILAGLNGNKWSKEFAFGISPNAKNMHYLVHKGIKYIEAIDDPTRFTIKAHMKPDTPVGAQMPKDPYFIKNDKAYYYDFKTDPLGLIELLYRGDRAYDLSDAKSEWKAKQIMDESVLKNFKRQTLLLSARSVALGKKMNSCAKNNTAVLTEKEKMLLESLGYGGMLDSGSGLNAGGGNNSTTDLKTVPALVDRSLLIKGDNLIWDMTRFVFKKADPPSEEDFNSRLEEARSCYEQFKAKYPNMDHWITWRLESLKVAKKMIQENKAK